MRILHILHRSVPGTHGYAIRSSEIVNKQLARGVEPIVVTSPSQAPLGSLDWERSEYIRGVRYFRSCGKLLPPSKEVHDRGPVRQVLRILQNILLLRTVRRVARLYRPDVIHAHSPFTCGLVADVVGRAEGIATVYEARGMWEESHATRHQVSRKSWRYRVIHFLEGIALGRADICCVIGEALKQEVLRRGIQEDRVVVVPNGVDVKTFVPGAADPILAERWGLRNALVMGYVGSFSRYERLDLLIEAIITLAPDFPDLRLLLVGDGDLMPVLRGMAADAGMSGRVIFTGRLNHEEIPDFYRLCTFLVLPRADMGKTQLITPLKPLEIMAMGKALIASDIAGHREIVHNGLNGVLFKAGNAQELVSTCREFARNKGLVADLGARARKWVQAERDWDVLVDRYIALYERLGQHGRRTEG